MRRLTMLLLMACSVFAAPATAAKSTLPPEQQLQEMLQGFTPGPPERCISTTRIRRMVVIEGTALVFSGGGWIYVNRPDNAAAMKRNQVPAFEPEGGKLLCRSASVSLMSDVDMFSQGAVRLNEWIPYRRDKAKKVD